MADPASLYDDVHEDEDYEDCDDEWACTWCGGTGRQENDDPLWYGGVPEIQCECCGGTGLREHQTIF